MSNLDCLFVHVPSIRKGLSMPSACELVITISAMGLVSMSNELTKHGYSSEIVNLGLEKVLDWTFSLSEYVKLKNVKCIAFSLHWFYQTYDTLYVVKKIKEEHPDIHITMGGYTSSAFAKDILEQHPYVDSVIKGEGERPIVELMEALEKNDLSQVSNLLYRKNNEIIINKKIWVANKEELDSYNFMNFENYKNRDSYFKIPLVIDTYKKPILNKNLLRVITCLGRGCPGNCTWCGGGANAVKLLSNRTEVTLRSPNVVANEIITAYEKYNINNFYICYDPFPKNQNYVIELFEILGKTHKNEIEIGYENFGLPSKDFIYSVKENLSPNSKIVLSPEFGDEELRALHKPGFSYTNSELMNCIYYLKELNIDTLVYFAEIPGMTSVQKMLTGNLVHRLTQTGHPRLQITKQPIDDFEPFAPWSINPEKFNVTPNVKTLEDYYLLTKGIRDLF